MIVELGHFCLVIACVLAGLQMVLPSVGLFRGNLLLINTGRSLASGVFLFTVLSFCGFTYAFFTNDFSVAYVAGNYNTLFAWQYQFSAVWGAHEGSFLLWTLVMSTWTLLVANFSKPLSDEFRARVLIVMAGLSVGFYLFLLLTSNPFERTLPFYPSEGADLNPLLQDFGLIVHPPLLYMGYVGLAVP
ncbi:MAG: cytochrome c biogenesis protein CcsA, partial [Pseudomonadales bacterium]